LRREQVGTEGGRHAPGDVVDAVPEYLAQVGGVTTVRHRPGLRDSGPDRGDGRLPSRVHLPVGVRPGGRWEERVAPSTSVTGSLRRLELDQATYLEGEWVGATRAGPREGPSRVFHQPGEWEYP